MRAQEVGDRHEMQSKHYTVHPPGEYIDEPPLQDYPVVEAVSPMAAQVVGGWLRDADTEVKSIDGVAWAVLVPV